MGPVPPPTQLPVALVIPGGLNPERTIFIEAGVKLNAKWFYISLQCGPSLDDQDDIAFRVLMNFVTNPPTYSTNSCVNGKWEDEYTYQMDSTFLRKSFADRNSTSQPGTSKKDPKAQINKSKQKLATDAFGSEKVVHTNETNTTSKPGTSISDLKANVPEQKLATDASGSEKVVRTNQANTTSQLGDLYNDSKLLKRNSTADNSRRKNLVRTNRANELRKSSIERKISAFNNSMEDVLVRELSRSNLTTPNTIDTGSSVHKNKFKDPVNTSKTNPKIIEKESLKKSEPGDKNDLNADIKTDSSVHKNVAMKDPVNKSETNLTLEKDSMKESEPPVKTEPPRSLGATKIVTLKKIYDSDNPSCSRYKDKGSKIKIKDSSITDQQKARKQFEQTNTEDYDSVIELKYTDKNRSRETDSHSKLQIVEKKTIFDEIEDYLKYRGGSIKDEYKKELITSGKSYKIRVNEEFTDLELREIDLRPGHGFTLALECLENGYLLSLNEELYAAYPHQVNYELVNYIVINGDIDIEDIEVGGGRGPDRGIVVDLYKETVWIEDVTVLTDDNFGSLVLSSQEMWLVDLYAGWCPACQRLKPQWEDAATMLKGRVKVGASDCDRNEELAETLAVKYYPSIYWYPKGKKHIHHYHIYPGACAKETIVTYALYALGGGTGMLSSVKPPKPEPRTLVKRRETLRERGYKTGGKGYQIIPHRAGAENTIAVGPDWLSDGCSETGSRHVDGHGETTEGLEHAKIVLSRSKWKKRYNRCEVA